MARKRYRSAVTGKTVTKEFADENPATTIAETVKDTKNMANEEKKAAAEKTDLAEEIGTLTYPRAVKHFGKAKALDVMKQVAAIGGHGLFEDHELMSPLFGGLAMPSPELVRPPLEAEFAHLPEAEFWYQSALEEHEGNKGKAVKARDEINALFASLK